MNKHYISQLRRKCEQMEVTAHNYESRASLIYVSPAERRWLKGRAAKARTDSAALRERLKGSL